MTHSPRFLATPHARPEARVRLFLFHHAGGSHAIFRTLAARLPDWIEPVLLCYPARLALYRVPLPDTIEELAALLREPIEPLLDRPFALFGHSMGALLGYVLTRQWLAEERQPPCWLGVSAFEAPCRAARRVRLRALHRFPDDDLRAHVKALGGTPEALFDDAWQQFASLIRRDLALFEQWSFNPRAPTLPMPVQAFVGEQDPLVGADGCGMWRYFSERWQGITTLPGDHFYFLGKEARMAGLLADGIAQAVGQAALT